MCCFKKPLLRGLARYHLRKELTRDNITKVPKQYHCTYAKNLREELTRLMSTTDRPVF